MAPTLGKSDPQLAAPRAGDVYRLEIVHTDPDGGDYGGHILLYGRGDDDSTWARMVLTDPIRPIERKSRVSGRSLHPSEFSPCHGDHAGLDLDALAVPRSSRADPPGDRGRRPGRANRRIVPAPGSPTGWRSGCRGRPRRSRHARAAAALPHRAGLPQAEVRRAAGDGLRAGQRPRCSSPSGTARSSRSPTTRRPSKAELVLDLKRHLYGLAFHPEFAKNGYLYVSSLIEPTGGPAADGAGLPAQGRAGRPAARRPAERARDHRVALAAATTAAASRSGRDGYLYIAHRRRQRHRRQRPGPGATCRLHPAHRRRPCRRAASPTRVPQDNPFVGIAGARPEIWAYGLRQPWKFSFDRATGDLWAGEVGQDLWEMVYQIEKGGNYGWSVTEGSHPFQPERKKGPTPDPAAGRRASATPSSARSPAASSTTARGCRN